MYNNDMKKIIILIVILLLLVACSDNNKDEKSIVKNNSISYVMSGIHADRVEYNVHDDKFLYFANARFLPGLAEERIEGSATPIDENIILVGFTHDAGLGTGTVDGTVVSFRYDVSTDTISELEITEHQSDNFAYSEEQATSAGRQLYDIIQEFEEYISEHATDK